MLRFVSRLRQSENSRQALFWAAWAATLYHGATQHVPAFVLRVALVAYCLKIWSQQRCPHRLPQPFPQPLPLGRGAACGVACLLGGCAWGLGITPRLGFALQPAATLACAVLCFITFATTDHATVQKCRDIVFSVGVVHSVWAILQRCHLLAGPPQRATGGFYSPIDLAALLPPLLLWSWHCSRCAVLPRARFVYRAALGIMLMGLWCTGSRAGIGATLLSVAGVVIFGGATSIDPQMLGAPRPKKTFTPYVRRALAGAVVVSLSAYALRYRFNVRYDPYAFARLNIWRACLEVFQQAPQGVGLGAFEARLQAHGVMVFGPVRYPHIANTAHSELFQAAVELGLPGLLALGVLCWGTATAVWRLGGTQAVAHSAIGLCFALPALCHTTFHLPCIAVLFALWTGDVRHQGSLLLGVRRQKRLPLDAHDQRRLPLKMAQPTAAIAEWLTRKVVRRSLAMACTVALAPGCTSTAALTWATHLHSSGGPPAAVARWAAFATATMPWSCATALSAHSLVAAGPPPMPPLEQAEQLVTIADAYPDAAEPLRRGAEVLQSIVQSPAQWTQISSLWQAAAARRPHDALLWLQAAHAADRGMLPGDAPPLFARAVAEEPGCAGAWVGLAQLAWARHEQAIARSALERARASMSLAPQHTGYAQHLLSLDSSEKVVFNKLTFLLKSVPP